MSLLEALLLDPPRINVWIARRTDGAAGSGTQADPYDGSTLSKFDSVMNGLANNTCVHLGPGEFQTAGYATDNSASAWQAKPGMRIVGSGMGVTTIKLVNGTNSKMFYAVGHALSSTTVDAFEICDLTIDCNLANAGTSSSAGAVRVMGSNSRVVRVRAVNWGNKNSSSVSYVIAMLTGDGVLTPTVTNAGIQECVVTTPGSGHVGYVAALHVGYTEAPGATPAVGISPYIRGCFVDCGQTTLANNTSDKIFRGLSMGWCRGGIIEGNTIQNTFHGGPYNTLGSDEVIIRNNLYSNVAVGPLYTISTTGTRRVRVEGNRIELTRVSVNPIIGESNVWAQGVVLYNAGGGAGVTPFSNVVVRNNYVGYVSTGTIGANPAGAVFVYGATNLFVTDNLLDLEAITAPPAMMNRYCNAVRYSENRTPAGSLKQGVRATGAVTYDLVYTELATDADDALILSILKP